MIEEGAAIIDIGGESTRPGAAPATLDEELARVIPVIEALRRESAVFISVDTSKPEVMRAACDAGADIINDVRALDGARRAGRGREHAAPASASCTCRASRAPCRQAPRYEDVVGEVGAFLAARIAACRDAGIDAARLAVDPGFGFGKRIVDNLALLKHLGAIPRAGRAARGGAVAQVHARHAHRPRRR